MVLVLLFVVALTCAAVVAVGEDGRGSGESARGPDPVSTISVAPPPRAPTLAPVENQAPRYPVVTTTGAWIDGAMFDVHLPLAASARRKESRYPLALLLPRRGVHTSQYAQLAHELGTRGITVVIAPRSDQQTAARVERWARDVAADPEAIGHRIVARRISFVVAHDDGLQRLGRLPPGVRAVARFAPGRC